MAFLIMKEDKQVAYLVNNREVSKERFNEKFVEAMKSGREYSKGSYNFDGTEYAYVKF